MTRVHFLAAPLKEVLRVVDVTWCELFSLLR